MAKEPPGNETAGDKATALEMHKLASAVEDEPEKEFSRSEKQDLQITLVCQCFNIMGAMLLIFWFIYYCIVYTGSGKYTVLTLRGQDENFFNGFGMSDQVISRKIFLVLVKDPHFWKMIIFGLIALCTNWTMARSNVKDALSTPLSAQISRVLTITLGAVFVVVYYHDCFRQWQMWEARRELHMMYGEEYKVLAVNRMSVVFCIGATTLYLISLHLFTPLLFTMGGITPFPKPRLSGKRIPA